MPPLRRMVPHTHRHSRLSLRSFLSRSAGGSPRGLRDVTRAQWDGVLEAAKCTILGTMSNDKCDSYILSESSLFVYTHKMVLKTCGTTTLLRCLDPLMRATEVGCV